MADEHSLAGALADRYRIGQLLGSGGMATVYLAQDMRHDRKVAIKVLRAELAAVIGAERFLAEIKTTANLQHPHILPLFDSGEAGRSGGGNGRTFLFYVMPYIEGESLRDRLNREKQLPIADALRIAGEVASALDYAHRHAVIHRDIKPENILLHDGTALVADFGIALAASRAGSSRMTETGMSLGTPHYMSPEQAMGEREITARSDVYALGAVLYEMLVGDPPFTGSTAQAVVAKVMTEKPPPIRRQRERVPETVETAILTALEKLPADRFGSAAEFAAALTKEAPEHQRGKPLLRPGSRPTVRVTSAAVVAGIALVSFLLGGYILARPVPPLEFGQSVQVTAEPGLEVQPAISPDGKSVAYAGGTSTDTRIYVRQVAGGRASPITGDSSNLEASPRWSPDGTRLLFLSRGAVFSAPSAGGAARQEVPASPRGPVVSADWAPDGATIAYAVADSLFIRAGTGEVRGVARINEPSHCTWSPGANLIACASGNARYLTLGTQFGNLSPSRVVIVRLSDGWVTTVTDSTSLNVSPIWSPDGRWLYYVSNRRGPRDIHGLRIGSGGRPSGEPVRLSTGLGAQSISISKDGSRFAYAVYSATANVWSLPIPTGGPVSAKTATPVTRGDQVIENLRVSPDGRWLIYDSDRTGNAELYRVPFQGGEPERLTSDPADDFGGDLSPDGREIAFHSWRAGSRDIYVLPLDGRPLQRVTSSPGQELIPVWSPDGTALVFNHGNDYRSISLVRRREDGAWGEPVDRLERGAWPNWSPDGRYIVYGDHPLGGSLAVIPADSGEPRIVLDATRPGMPKAELPYWSRDGGTIYFKSHGTGGDASFWSVPAAGGPPRRLVYFDDPAWPSYRAQWAVGRDRFFFPVEDRQSNVWVMERVME